MIFSRNSAALLVGLLFIANVAVWGYQDVKEINTIHDALMQNSQGCAKILKMAHTMRNQAIPFTRPHHEAKFRFQPNDFYARQILDLTRYLRSRYQLLNGILYHSSYRNRVALFKAIHLSLDTVVNSSKRSLRAIRDGNFALYLASAATMDREARILFQYTVDLEFIIDQVIQLGDSKKEDL